MPQLRVLKRNPGPEGSDISGGFAALEGPLFHGNIGGVDTRFISSGKFWNPLLASGACSNYWL